MGMSVAGELSEQTRTGLDEAEVSFSGGKGEAVDGYLAKPAQGGPHPGLIVIHEAFGLNEHIRDVARRFAAIGYVSLAPDLYTREQLPAEPEPEEIMRAVQAQSDERAIADLRAAVEHLAEQPDANGKVGCVGFCSGGRQALMLACADVGLDAAINCWGGNIRAASPEEETTPQRPVPPIEMAESLSCPLMLAVGAEDRNPSPEDTDVLAERLIAAGKECELNVYERAGHAFFADYRPSYVEVPAHLLWEDMVEFLGYRLAHEG
jgi:carboxymethylenebutenolidase